MAHHHRQMEVTRRAHAAASVIAEGCLVGARQLTAVIEHGGPVDGVHGVVVVRQDAGVSETPCPELQCMTVRVELDEVQRAIQDRRIGQHSRDGVCRGGVHGRLDQDGRVGGELIDVVDKLHGDTPGS